MFTKIKLNNFKSFGNIEFDLTSKNGSPKNFAVVFGENGAGKSNLMSVFVFLQEVFSTMDVRELYEEFLSKQAIYIDENLENRRKQMLKDGLRDIQAIINDYKMVGCDEPVSVEFNFQIKGNEGKYIITLGESEIIHEKLEYILNKRKGIYFECSGSEITINNSIIKEKKFLKDIKSSAERYWGKHSIIAIILHELFDKSKSYGIDNISNNFRDVLDTLTMVSCYLVMGTRKWNRLYSPFDVFDDPAQGIIDVENEKELNVAEEIFSRFFRAINSDIKRVYYDRIYNDKEISYKLFFEKLVSGQYRQIPFSKESTGNHQLLRVLCFLFSASLGNVIVIDEADSGIHDYLFLKILQEVIPYIDGQIIMSTHNTMLMEADFSRNSTYILSEDEMGCKMIRAISDYDKRTYLSNNIRNKYMNNEYGGLPNVTAIDFEQLIKELEKAFD